MLVQWRNALVHLGRPATVRVPHCSCGDELDNSNILYINDVDSRILNLRDQQYASISKSHSLLRLYVFFQHFKLVWCLNKNCEAGLSKVTVSFFIIKVSCFKVFSMGLLGYGHH